MDNFHRDLDAFGKELKEKLSEYAHAHGKVPRHGPAAQLQKLQKAQAELAARANAVGQSEWEAAKITLEAERKALRDEFSKWVALIDAQYRDEI
ncbi:MAG: hypothetical protein Q9M33_07540 [Robiginitomaculum sp.]|nr:hypothetical protein [Robiginitomaculum sp.]MDQ7077998.1 hypothetical protein [Robiginitomaculum sp.]